MPLYDNDGTADYTIGKIYDNDGTANYQIKLIYDNNGTTDTLLYTAEESHTITTKSGGDGWDETYGNWGSVSLSIPAGETFRITNISFSVPIYTTIHVKCSINNEVTEIYNYSITVGTEKSYSVGPYPSNDGVYISTTDIDTIKLSVRGWRSTSSWFDGNTHYQSATLTTLVGA